MGAKTPSKKRQRCRVCLAELVDREQKLCNRCWQRELFVTYELTPEGAQVARK